MLEVSLKKTAILLTPILLLLLLICLKHPQIVNHKAYPQTKFEIVG